MAPGRRDKTTESENLPAIPLQQLEQSGHGDMAASVGHSV